MGDQPDAYPIEHGFDEMKHYAAYYPGVYTYSDTSVWFHPWFPSYNQEYAEEYFKIVNMYEWNGVAGQPATKGGEFSWDFLATFDVKQTDAAMQYIKDHAKSDKPFFMDVNLQSSNEPTLPTMKNFQGPGHDLSHWNLHPWLSDSAFDFKKHAGAKETAFLPELKAKARQIE